MPTERLRFPGAFGDSLAARLEVPADREPLAYALFAHCFTCSKGLKAIRRRLVPELATADEAVAEIAGRSFRLRRSLLWAERHLG